VGQTLATPIDDLVLETHHAPAARKSAEELETERLALQGHALIQSMVPRTKTPLGVLNACRQLLILNDAFVAALGFSDVDTAYGLRLGEALGCQHSDAMPGGCGTAAACRECGATKSIVEALAAPAPARHRCVIHARRGFELEPLSFIVRATGYDIGTARFVLLAVQLGAPA
jgi:hypothetical protein